MAIIRLFFLSFFVILNITVVIGQTPQLDLVNKYKNTPSQLTASEYLKLSHVYYRKDSLLKSNQIINEGLVAADKEEDKKTKASLLMQKGYINLYWGSYDKALDYFTQCHNLAREIEDTSALIGGYHGKGRVYSEIDDYEQAVIQLNQGLELANLGAHQRTIAILHNAMGIALQGLDKDLEAIYHFEINEKLSREIGDSLTELFAIINKGTVYLDIDSLQRANDCFLLALQKNLSIQSQYAEAAIQGNIGNLALFENDLNKAKKHSFTSVTISRKNNFIPYLIESYETISEVYIKLNDYENALRYYKLQKELEDSVLNSEKIADINRLKIQHEAENQEANAKIFEAKLRNRNILSISVILFSVFTIIILILLYSRFRLNKKIHKKEKEELNFTIDEKNRQLMVQLMETKMKHRILDEAGILLEAIDKSKDQDELKSKVEEFKNTVQKTNKVEEDWQKINYHFEKVHPDFFKKLRETHPNLSNNDLKLCAYTKMNLATKDIANLMNISYRSVQTNRYRIKKKMKLDDETNFTSYIQTV
jgi:tetratricopeptide (TPR) repeat protein